MRTFHLTPYYFLLQAFDKTGEAMFGEDWSGQEVRTGAPTMDLRPIKAEQEAIEIRLLSIADRQAAIRGEVNLQLSPEERERVGGETIALREEQIELRVRRSELPDLTHMTNEDAERFERRCAVETELRTAIQNGALRLIAGDGLIVEWNKWAMEDGFNVNFYLSTVQVPASILSTGSAPALVLIEEFETWLKRFGVPTAPPDPIPLITQLENFFREQFKGDPELLTPREAFFDLASKTFPDASLRKLRQAWDNAAPDERRKGGRKRKRV
ncbi:hypothetical protein [Aliiroseovarius sp. F47248L]|uniref:hypothetical protein n=1 Tax=Aliiroseovarius sp. F47248L TaxID=2926420 RepID=UPI001FF6E784|nr:hypothetical protein [Aliiroseovarius sp. F47248L]MCK0140015.1 hypothetical protein [Aliiroseovarius sp. F47248L]